MATDIAVSSALRVPTRMALSKAASLHRWLGLVLGAVISISGLTGSYLAFHSEIERSMIAPLRASPGIRTESIESVYLALSQIANPEKGSWNIELPNDGGVITSRFSSRGSDSMRMVSLDPASLRVVRDVRWGDTVSTWLYELHYRLLMGRAGGTLMGVIALLLMVALSAGLVLWWRSARSMCGRLTPAAQGTAQRKIFDAHRLLGLGASLFLLISLSTAAMMSLPQQVRPVISQFSPIEPLPKPQSQLPSADGRGRISVDRAITAAQARFPEGDIRWVKVPGRPSEAYTIRLRLPGDPDRRFPRSYVWVDQYSGHVLAVRDFRSISASDRILAWLYLLHSGEAFGLVGRGVVAMLGGVPAILFTTGLLRWRSKSARFGAYKRRQRPAISSR